MATATGKKKIEIKKIENDRYRMVTFSKRRQGLLKKNAKLESITGSRVASVVFSPGRNPYTYGDVNSAIEMIRKSTLGMNSHPSSSDVVSGGASATPRRNGLRDWVEGIDVEKYQNLNQLLLLKEQLEGTRTKVIEDAESFEPLFGCSASTPNTPQLDSYD